MPAAGLSAKSLPAEPAGVTMGVTGSRELTVLRHFRKLLDAESRRLGVENPGMEATVVTAREQETLDVVLLDVDEIGVIFRTEDGCETGMPWTSVYSMTPGEPS